ncbi:hypothetical protein [Tranquillimonas alkanivorans]|uniref:DUF2214 domain-containing protein n=1 Tax=Tranquillimonas alkanivorans TaxID=441119 RepID=A0A1I5NYQ5_9RHOB|nr:hypothetical protein [Tranquillimonas alkanivorans]SFP26919.1 hypothetical protein SAMN04488047_104147 [Tranquillimonas alkanivorans]
MTDLAAALEATALAQHLKASRWTYPLVNAGHILGLALLIGAVVPMDLRLLGLMRRPALPETVALLRPIAATGLTLAATFGALLFFTQASDYIGNRWFLAKLSLVALGLLNAALHPALADIPPARQRAAALASLAIWPAALICGRLIAYS